VLLIHDALAKFSQIIYGRNHPIYQNILIDHVLMPQELREGLDKFATGSKTMTIGKCQGGDALLEELNKDSKSWLKMAGIPGDDQ